MASDCVEINYNQGRRSYEILFFKTSFFVATYELSFCLQSTKNTISVYSIHKLK